MRYLDNFKAFESNIHEIGLEDDIENNCFLDLMDRGFKIEILPLYMSHNGRRLEYVDNGLDISITNSNIFKVSDILDELLTAKEYIEEKYNMKLDFIANKDTEIYCPKYKTFDEILNVSLTDIRMTFKPIGFLTKAKNYIKNKFK